MISATRRLALPVLLLLSVIFVTACGDEKTTKAEYQKQVNKVMNSVKTEDFSSGDPEAAKRGAKQIEDAADDLDDITPPDDVKDLHEDFVDEVRELGKIMGKTAPILAAAKRDPATAADKLRELASLQQDSNEVLSDLAKTIDGFKKQGYDTGG